MFIFYSFRILLPATATLNQEELHSFSLSNAAAAATAAVAAAAADPDTLSETRKCSAWLKKIRSRKILGQGFHWTGGQCYKPFLRGVKISPTLHSNYVKTGLRLI